MHLLAEGRTVNPCTKPGAPSLQRRWQAWLHRVPGIALAAASGCRRTWPSDPPGCQRLALNEEDLQNKVTGVHSYMPLVSLSMPQMALTNVIKQSLSFVKLTATRSSKVHGFKLTNLALGQTYLMFSCSSLAGQNFPFLKI